MIMPPSSNHPHARSQPTIGHSYGEGGNRPRARSRSSYSSGYDHYSEFDMSEVSHDSAHHGRGLTAHMDSGFEKKSEQPRWETKEEKRLREDEHKLRYWRRWGPYLSERQWVSEACDSKTPTPTPLCTTIRLTSKHS